MLVSGVMSRVTRFAGAAWGSTVGTGGGAAGPRAPAPPPAPRCLP